MTRMKLRPGLHPGNLGLEEILGFFLHILPNRIRRIDFHQKIQTQILQGIPVLLACVRHLKITSPFRKPAGKSCERAHERRVHASARLQIHHDALLACRNARLAEFLDRRTVQERTFALAANPTETFKISYSYGTIGNHEIDAVVQRRIAGILPATPCPVNLIARKAELPFGTLPPVINREDHSGFIAILWNNFGPFP